MKTISPASAGGDERGAEAVAGLEPRLRPREVDATRARAPRRAGRSSRAAPCRTRSARARRASAARAATGRSRSRSAPAPSRTRPFEKRGTTTGERGHPAARGRPRARSTTRPIRPPSQTATAPRCSQRRAAAPARAATSGPRGRRGRGAAAPPPPAASAAGVASSSATERCCSLGPVDERARRPRRPRRARARARGRGSPARSPTSRATGTIAPRSNGPSAARTGGREQHVDRDRDQRDGDGHGEGDVQRAQRGAAHDPGDRPRDQRPQDEQPER